MSNQTDKLQAEIATQEYNKQLKRANQLWKTISLIKDNIQDQINNKKNQLRSKYLDSIESLNTHTNQYQEMDHVTSIDITNMELAARQLNRDYEAINRLKIEIECLQYQLDMINSKIGE